MLGKNIRGLSLFRWLGDFVAATDLPPLRQVTPQRPAGRPQRDLGPAQLAWCEANLTFAGKPVFKDARASVLAVEANVAANRAQMEGAGT